MSSSKPVKCYKARQCCNCLKWRLIHTSAWISVMDSDDMECKMIKLGNNIYLSCLEPEELDDTKWQQVLNEWNVTKPLKSNKIRNDKKDSGNQKDFIFSSHDDMNDKSLKSNKIRNKKKDDKNQKNDQIQNNQVQDTNNKPIFSLKE